MAALILLAWGLVGYLAGSHRERQTAVFQTAPVPPEPGTPHFDRSVAVAPPSEEKKPTRVDDQVAALRSQAHQSQQELSQLKEKLGQVGRELAERNENLNRNVEDRAELSRQLDSAEVNAERH